MIIDNNFFNRDTCLVARQLLGKVIRHRVNGKWLAARIIETEAYYLNEKGSHASLGYTDKRRALFMPPGTIYMYYARGKDSFNISTRGKGNAVLIKAAYPHEDSLTCENTIQLMQKFNPDASGQARPVARLCRGQTLLCAALQLKVSEWDQQQFSANRLYLDDNNIKVSSIIQTTRLGIPAGRDEHLFYRFIDFDYAGCCTSNPLRKRGAVKNRHYRLLEI